MRTTRRIIGSTRKRFASFQSISSHALGAAGRESLGGSRIQLNRRRRARLKRAERLSCALSDREIEKSCVACELRTTEQIFNGKEKNCQLKTLLEIVVDRGSCLLRCGAFLECTKFVRSVNGAISKAFARSTFRLRTIAIAFQILSNLCLQLQLQHD